VRNIVVRGSPVTDGTGGPRVTADVGIRQGCTAEVVRTAARGRREIDADGRRVQRAEDCAATRCSAEAAGALPGRLVRGARPVPVA